MLLCLGVAAVDTNAEDIHPALRHGPPGSVIYDSISTMPEKVRQSIEKSAIPGDPYAEPLREQDVHRYASFRERIRDDSSIVGKIKIKLSSIQESELAGYQYMGLIPEGPKREGPWTSLTRVFLRPDGAPIFFFEWDFPADGGSIVVFK